MQSQSPWVIRPQILVFIALCSVLVIVIARPGVPAQRLVSQWQPTPVITQPDIHADGTNDPTPVPLTGDVTVSAALDLSVDDGLYPDERDALAAEVQEALAYTMSRVGTAPSDRFLAAIQIDAGCGLHGIAYTAERNVRVYTCQGIGRQRAVNIMAHEIVHQLAHDRYGEAHLHTDLILLEGIATWGAGKYWLGGQPDFRSYVRAQRQAGGPFYPLATHYNGLGIAGMNALYYQWASFVEFLIEAYGRDKFDQVYVLGDRAPGSADYAGVYGKDLATLEQEWVGWLDG